MPRPAAAPATPTVWQFHYATGTFRYIVESSGTIELEADTAKHQVPVTTTTSYTVTLSPSAGGQLVVRGVADSFSVSRGTEIPGPRGDSSQTRLPIPFSATIAASGQVLGFQGAPATACDSAVDLMAAGGRNLLIPIPPSLTDSSEWDDSTSTTSCRGGVPVTTTAIQHYRVAGDTTFDGTTALQIIRTTTIHITGKGTPKNRTDGTFELTGAGTSSAALYLDPRSGTFLGGSSTGQADITITTDRGSLPFHQEVREEIRLQG